jgi:hypothetical protein
MPYSQVLLSALIAQIQTILDDPTGAYYVTAEVQLAIYEALRCFGALTGNWRQRGTFTITPKTPWYDLSVQLPSLRSRVTTLNTLITQMQYMLLENPSGIAGTGMSGQVTVGDLLSAVQRVRNLFVIDTRFPTTVHPPDDLSIVSPDGLIQLPDTTVYLHRLAFQDATSGAWSNLWRTDSWAADHNNQLWTIQPATPQSFSQSENSPLTAQLIPPPVNAGGLEAITVDSLEIDITNPNATLGIPDEWVWCVLYGALASVFSGGQTDDPLRYQYCAQRYQQGVEAARAAKSVIRLMLGNVPLPLDAMANIDAGFPYWRNQPGSPQMAGALYDLVGFAGIPDQPYSVTADVVRSAPLPALSDPIQVGPEDVPLLVEYAVALLTFKCGGSDFTSNIGGLQHFMDACAMRNNILKVKAVDYSAIFGQWQFEQAQRPDRMEKKPVAA